MKFLKAPVPATAVSVSLILVVDSCFGQNWTLTGAPTNSWAAVACSADASRLVAVATNRAIYTSTNSGATWTSNNSPIARWSAVVSSADGTRLAATINQNAVFVYTSTNSGATWSPSLTNARYYSAISSSTNGSKLVVVAWDQNDAMFLTSLDSGASWMLTDEEYPVGPIGSAWAGSAVASSANGSRVTAMLLWSWGGYLPSQGIHFYSVNSGLTWSGGDDQSIPFAPLAASADGFQLVGAGTGGGLRSAAIYTSINTGSSWTSNNVPASHWTSVATSADASRLVGVSADGLIYTSEDSGASWIPNNAPPLQWTSVASSADGSKLVAASSQGIYIRQAAPTLNVTLSDGSLVLSWPASSVGFSLQQNPDLTTANWTTATNTLTATGGQNQVTLLPTQANCFYRLTYP